MSSVRPPPPFAPGSSESKIDVTSPSATTSPDAEEIRMEDIDVFPAGALPASSVCMRSPDFSGPSGFRALKTELYDSAKSKAMLTSIRFEVRVQDGEIGYYSDRDARLHLLKPGKHVRGPLSRVSPLRVAGLDTDTLALPPEKPQLFVVRVDPGTLVACQQGGIPLFLEAGTNTTTGLPEVGFHLIRNDLTFQILERVPQDHPVISAAGSFIITVPPSHVCKALVNRDPVLLGAGRHLVTVSGFTVPPNPFVNINEEVLVHETITIVRVPPAKVFLASLALKPITLRHRPTSYLFTDPTFKPAPAPWASVTDSVIMHETLCEVQLDRGQVALAHLDNTPLILGSSQVIPDAIDKFEIDVKAAEDDGLVYRFDSPQFRIERHPDGSPQLLWLSEEHVIRHDTILLIRVDEGELCRVFLGSKPLILEHQEEMYVFNSPLVRLADEAVNGYGPFASTSALHVEHGVFHRITVPQGQVCRVWNHGHAELLGVEVFKATALGAPEEAIGRPTSASLDLGLLRPEEEGEAGGQRYLITSNNFHLDDDPWVNQSSKLIQHGALCIVTVEDGEVAIVRNQGKRQALGPGCYSFSAPERVYERHLYTGVRTTPPQDIVTYDSQRIPIRVKFTVTFEINKPSIACQYQGDGGLDQFLATACHSSLRSSVNQTHILDMGRGNDLKRMKDSETAMEERRSSEEQKKAESELETLFNAGEEGMDFHNQFHVAFQHQNQSLTAQLERVGVSLIDLSIQDWSIEDEAVSRRLEELAMATVEAQLENAKVEARATAAQLEAKGRAAVVAADVEVENESTLSRARAKLEAARIEAEAIVMRAEAESKAIELKGAAEAKAKRERLEALGSTPQEEWMRQMQESCSNALSGASVTVAPEGVSNLFALLNAGSPMFTSMREQSASCLRSAGAASLKPIPHTHLSEAEAKARADRAGPGASLQRHVSIKSAAGKRE